MSVPRGPRGRRRYRTDYIADRDLFRAVAFSRSMIAEGTAPGRAFAVAARYYMVRRDDVAHYAAQYAGSMGGKAAAGKPRLRKKRAGDNCSTCAFGAHDSHGWWCFKAERTPDHLQLDDGCSDWKARPDDGATP